MKTQAKTIKAIPQSFRASSCEVLEPLELLLFELEVDEVAEVAEVDWITTVEEKEVTVPTSDKSNEPDDTPELSLEFKLFIV